MISCEEKNNDQNPGKRDVVIDPGKRGIIYENYSDFSTSVFHKVYDRANRLMEQIISEDEEIKAIAHHGNEFRNREQIDNIIAFVGRRGTGKTSAMLSFMERLKYSGKKRENGSKEKIDCYEYIGLEWIDASLLEKNEDIFDTILAKMFGDFMKITKDLYGTRKSDLNYDKQELAQQFDRIYTRISNLKRKNTAYQEENSLNILRDMARSNEIREDFKKLIKSYINFVSDAMAFGERYQNNASYLVVAIDDIDLNVEQGYEILEQIHRYLMVPGLIVLVAINYEEMLLCCERRYAKAYENLPENIISDIGKRAIQMSEEYLEKVLPPYRRVYLPSLKKMDYALRDYRKIKIGTKMLGIKEAIFKLILDKTGVFYDAKGKKRHFMEPVTLRNLSSNFHLYEDMQTLDLSGEDGLALYDMNYYTVMDDILFRFASDSLPNKEYELFMKWSEEEVLRRGEEIVDSASKFIFPVAENVGNKNNDEIYGFVEDYNQFGYSYGELMRSLYCMSRTKVYDKRLVHVLLDQYTVVFSRIYEHYKKSELPQILKESETEHVKEDKEAKDNKETKENREILKELMGSSVGGSWAKYMLPRVDKKISEEISGGEEYWGASQYTTGETIFICKFEEELPASDAEEKSSTEEEPSTEEESSTDKKWLRCKRIIRSNSMEALKLWMFFFGGFSCKRASKKKYSFEISKLGSKEIEEFQGAQRITEEESDGNFIKVSETRMAFNILNFVNNSFDYLSVIRDFYAAIIDSIYRHWEEELKDDELDKRINDLIKKDRQDDASLLKSFDHWAQKGCLAIPIYNFDITYNLFKRQIVTCRRRADGLIKPEDTYGKIVELFEGIKECLKQQDDFYNHLSEKGSISDFSVNFEECPIVKRILKEKEKYEGVWKQFMLYSERVRVKEKMALLNEDPGTNLN